MTTAEDHLDDLDSFEKRITSELKRLNETNDRGHTELGDLIEEVKLKMAQSFKKLDGTVSGMGHRAPPPDAGSAKQQESTSPLPRVGSPSGMNSGLAQSDSRGKRLEAKIDQLRTDLLPKMVDDAEQRIND